MNKLHKIFFAVFLLVIMVVSCQKKLFYSVEIKGRLLHFFTKEPIQSKVELYADDAHSAKNSQEHSQRLNSSQSNSDGYFAIKSRASKSSGGYYLHFPDDPLKTSNDWDFYSYGINDDQTLDVGDLLVGEQIFYCRITLQSTTGSSITINGDKGKTYNYNSGTNTSFLHYLTYRKQDYYDNNHEYVINYHTTNLNVSYHKVSIPIISGDTLYTTINY